MNSRQVSCFLEAARCKSFTRAAQRLYVSQSSFSRSISQLEQELGMTLFRRNGFQGIDLTEPGTVMAKALASAVDDIGAAIERAHEIERQRKVRLTLGLLQGQLLDDHLSGVIARLRLAYPNLSMHIRRDTYHALMGSLATGEVDLVCMPDWQLADAGQLELFPHARIETVLAAPRRLVGTTDRRCHSIKEFAGLTFISVAETECGHIARLLERLFAAAGIDPPVILAQSLEEQIQLVEMGEGAILINPYNYICYSPNVSCLTVAELEPQPFSLAWRKASDSEGLAKLLELLRGQ